MKITHRLSRQYFSQPHSGPWPAEWSTGLNSEENRLRIQYLSIQYFSHPRSGPGPAECSTGLNSEDNTD